MSEVYIRVDDTNRVVFLHKIPFDPTCGLNTSRVELLKTGFFVDSVPEPSTVMGKRAILYYDHEQKKTYYEYVPAPLSTRERVSLLEDALNAVIMSKGTSEEVTDNDK